MIWNLGSLSGIVEVLLVRPSLYTDFSDPKPATVERVLLFSI
jgi:hypothetical protein